MKRQRKAQGLGHCIGFGLELGKDPCPMGRYWNLDDGRRKKRRRCEECSKKYKVSWSNDWNKRKRRLAREAAGPRAKPGPKPKEPAPMPEVRSISADRLVELELEFPGRADLFRLAAAAGRLKIVKSSPDPGRHAGSQVTEHQGGDHA